MQAVVEPARSASELLHIVFSAPHLLIGVGNERVIATLQRRVEHGATAVVRSASRTRAQSMQLPLGDRADPWYLWRRLAGPLVVPAKYGLDTPVKEEMLMSSRYVPFVLASALALSCAGLTHAQGCALAPEIFVGDTPFDTAGATEILNLTGICDPGTFGDDSIYHTIWFKWVAVSSEAYQISTCNLANFDTRLAVLENGCDPSNTIACLDDTTGCPTFTTTLEFTAVEGNTYYFAVGGYSAATLSGSGTLALGLAGGGGGGGICGGKNPQDCCTIGSAPGCSDETCCLSVCAADDFCCAVQWDGLCAEQALSLCQELCIVPCDAPAATVTETEQCGEDLNGGCNDPFGAFQAIAVGDIVAGTFWAELGSRDTDWYRITLTEATELTATLYASVPARTFLLSGSCPPATLAANPAAGGCPSSWTQCVPKGEYFIFVGMVSFEGFPCFGGIVNEYTLAITGVPCDASAPANDECEKPAPIETGDTPFDTTFATTSPLPLDFICDEGFGTAIVNDLWYAWEASCTGLATVSTCNQATFDTRLAAYTDCFGAIVACNDDATGCGLTSSMTFPCVQGTTYLIRVGGFSGGGTGTLSIGCSDPVVNDECEGASPIANGSTPFSTIGATTSPIPLDGACDEGFGLAFVNDIWFVYEVTCTGTVSVSTCNAANFDTRLAAYSDCFGSLVACNDDGVDCGLTSNMEFVGTKGQIVYIRVGGFSASGTGTLTISCGEGGGGCKNADACECAVAIALGDTAFSTVGANSDAPTASPAECGAFGTGFYRDIWFTFEPETDGQLTVSTCSQATYDTRLELWVGCPDAGGQLVACNDDGVDCTGFTSVMEAPVTCGLLYYIRLGSYASGTTGTGTLSVSQATGNSCEAGCVPGADRNDDGCVNGSDIAVILGNWDPTGTLGNGLGAGDANCDGVVNGSDIAIVLGGWLPCP